MVDSCEGSADKQPSSGSATNAATMEPNESSSSSDEHDEEESQEQLQQQLRRVESYARQLIDMNESQASHLTLNDLLNEGEESLESRWQVQHELAMSSPLAQAQDSASQSDRPAPSRPNSLSIPLPVRAISGRRGPVAPIQQQEYAAPVSLVASNLSPSGTESDDQIVPSQTPKRIKLDEYWNKKLGADFGAKKNKSSDKTPSPAHDADIDITDGQGSTSMGRGDLRDNLKICALCSGPGDLACSGCYSVVYCGTAHQEQHWRDHEISCNYFALRRSTQLSYQGPFQIVKEDDDYQIKALVNIPAKQKILEEIPVLRSPWPRAALRECENFARSPVLRIKSLTCFGCCSVLKGKIVRCGKCYLPLCSKFCGFEITHSSNECQLISQRQKFLGERDQRSFVERPYFDTDIEFLYEDVMIVRLILLFKKEEVQNFENNGAMMSKLKSKKWYSLFSTWKTEEDKRLKESVRGEYAFTNMKKLFPLSLSLVGEATLWKLFCIVEGNSFKMQLPFKRYNVLCTLLPVAKHSCIPNAHAFLHEKEDATIVVQIVSGKRIEKGSSITVSYVPLIFTFMERRLWLLDNYLFWCRCTRCLDGNDCRLFTASFQCNHCRNNKELGYLVPPKALLEKGPDPKPEISPKSVVEAKRKYIETLVAPEFDWKCSSHPDSQSQFKISSRGSTNTPHHHHDTYSSQYAFLAFGDEEAASTRCLGSLSNLTLYLSERSRNLHETNAVILKLMEDLLRGELFDLSDPKCLNLKELQMIVENYTKYESLMKTLNPAFEFQGYPSKSLEAVKGEYEKRMTAAESRMRKLPSGVGDPRSYVSEAFRNYVLMRRNL